MKKIGLDTFMDFRMLSSLNLSPDGGKLAYMLTGIDREKKKYVSRLFKEAVKWGGTLALWCRFALCADTTKGNKLVQFRRNVTKGLLGK